MKEDRFDWILKNEASMERAAECIVGLLYSENPSMSPYLGEQLDTV